ncbi:hypothetical protein F53441_14205 [Fusarium austroafricanum]|uniref:Uncharacterized protein n=1 Tax=Fusarium austroafricanum TaxID=2364996 RepID=A0A8H4JIL7_9HYPO|nr:hypothetical protein F53441_14205 [Fusarium austroafricanum]
MPGGRPADLPAQEDVTQTHIWTPDATGLVRDAWAVILSTVFTDAEGFMKRIKIIRESGRAGIDVAHLDSPRLNFFVHEVKASSHSTSNQSLARCKEQLMGYLSTLPNANSQRLWGALCIGKNVQFYYFRNGELEAHEAMLRIDRQL